MIERDGRLDGFLVWLTLDTGAGEPIDILAHEHCWLPVFFPLPEALDVSAGDRVESRSAAIVSGPDPHPDYILEGTVRRGGTVLSCGGRVINVVGTGQDLAEARAAAYTAAALVRLRGGWYRIDIAAQPGAAAPTAG